MMRKPGKRIMERAARQCRHVGACRHRDALPKRCRRKQSSPRGSRTRSIKAAWDLKVCKYHPAKIVLGRGPTRSAIEIRDGEAAAGRSNKP